MNTYYFWDNLHFPHFALRILIPHRLCIEMNLSFLSVIFVNHLREIAFDLFQWEEEQKNIALPLIDAFKETRTQLTKFENFNTIKRSKKCEKSCSIFSKFSRGVLWNMTKPQKHTHHIQMQI